MNTDILVDTPKKSYLDANYKFFAIKDTTTPAIDYHYHDFDKIILMAPFDFDKSITAIELILLDHLDAESMLLTFHHHNLDV